MSPKQQAQKLVPELHEIETEFDFPVFHAGDGLDAIEAWETLSAAREELGHLPVILGARDEVDMLLEAFEFNEDSADAYIAQADAAYAEFATPPESLPSPSSRELYEDVIANFSDAAAWERYAEAAAIEARHRAFGDLSKYDWPEGAVPAGRTISVPFDVLSGEPLEEAFLALVPTLKPWEVFAYIKFGGWNACPSPDEHVNWWRFWHDRYEMTIVSTSHDVVDAWPARPPSTKDDAMRLATQQYVYCNDIVDQGTGTVEALAGTLLDGESWYFWWD